MHLRSVQSLISVALLLTVLHGCIRAPLSSEPVASQSDAGPHSSEGRVLLGLWFALAVAVGVGLYLRPRREVLATLRRAEAAFAKRALTFQEEDRRRIARELHDGVGQALTGARLHLAALRPKVEQPEQVDLVVQQLDAAMAELRRAAHALAPPALAEFGLASALRRHCDSVAIAAQLQVECQLPGELPQLEATLETACYRIVQEALSNAARHAHAQHAWVRVEATATELQLEVGDDGDGLDPDAQPGLGLDSIRERARLAGGEVAVLNDAGPGPRIRVRLPRRSEK